LFKVHELTNDERTRVGKAPYYATTPLINAALAHAQDMSANNYFSHTSQDGKKKKNSNMCTTWNSVTD
jgi:uncharacterized protein YkwD